MATFNLQAPLQLSLSSTLTASGNLTISTDSEGNLAWDSVSGATGYRIYWGTDSGGPYPNEVYVGDVLTYPLASLGLSSGITYYLIVVGYNPGETLASNELEILDGEVL